jgi:glycosyltransferase involved in cell wall biosynthesis
MILARPIRVLCVTGHPDLPEAHSLAALASRGFEIRVLCSPAASTFELLDASAAVVTPFEISHRFDRRAVAKLRAEIASFEPDILHLFNNRAVLNGLRAARGSKVKIIAYRGNVGNVKVYDPLAWLRYLNPRVDRIVCVSEAVREYLAGVGILGWRLPSDKLVTIRKGHDLSWYAEPPVDLEPLGIPHGAFVVGCVANWRPRKGVEVLLEACARLPADAPIHLALVGNMRSPKLLKRIAANPCRDRIHLLGFRSDAAAVAGAFDVAVLPAIKREGLPKTVIEAMAYGVATVATRVGGVDEIIEDGVSGLIVPPGDPQALAEAILWLYERPDLRRELGRCGRERIGTELRIDDTIAKTAELYESLAPV